MVTGYEVFGLRRDTSEAYKHTFDTNGNYIETVNLNQLEKYKAELSLGVPLGQLNQDGATTAAISIDAKLDTTTSEIATAEASTPAPPALVSPINNLETLNSPYAHTRTQNEEAHITLLLNDSGTEAFEVPGGTAARSKP